MPSIATGRASRWAGFALGLAVAALLVSGWRLPPGPGALGADVSVSLAPTGELEASPTGRLLSAAGIVPGPPGSERHGAVGLRNLAGRRLEVALRALPSSESLDTSLRVVVAADDDVLYAGPLGGLRPWSARTFALGPTGRVRLSVALAIPGDTPDDAYRGRIEDITLELRPVAREGS